ncbi:M10 family metallopeptidase C-terminal domain-containing protein [Caulobacter sp. 73W]|uniref:M10 family metallopeptidase C-terminal domain-containing protein n=1 Tax=Caulobacter sp. 73W TaxID=3161137 RepID=A0AB39KR16_9CAUL
MRIDGGAGNDNRHGTAQADVFYMRKGDDVAAGWGGNDTLNGGDGNDTLTGGDGLDVLYGDAGNDELRGGADTDQLYGGPGNDRLWGGPGGDIFWFNSVNADTDTIQDFEVGSDNLGLTHIDANWNVAGDQDFRFIGSNTFSGQPGEVRYRIIDFQDGGPLMTWVELNTTGNGLPELIIAMVGAKQLTAADFFL